MKTKSILLSLLGLTAVIVATVCVTKNFYCQKNCNGSQNLFDTIYNDRGYLILKSQDFNEASFATKTYKAHGINPGKEIPDSVTNQELNEYRAKNKGKFQYVDFDLISLIDYLSHYKTNVSIMNDEMGIRAYLAYKLNTDSLTVIFSPTYQKKALWRVEQAASQGDIKAFNMGSTCPNNCPDTAELSNNP